MEYIRTHTVEFPTGRSCRLVVDSPSGATVVEGRDVDRATIQVVAHLWEDTADDADDTMARVVRSIRHENGSVRIEVPSLRSGGPWFLFGRGSRVELQIAVPRDTAARIVSRSGRVEIGRISGPLEVEQRSGRATVAGIDRDVRIASRSGAVDVESVGADVTIQSRTGKVTAREVRGNLSIQSRTGAVRVERMDGRVDIESRTGRTVVERVRGDVRVVTTTGAIGVAEAGGSVHLQATTGAVRLRSAIRGDVDIRVTTGAIVLEVDPRHPFFLDAETTTGRITSDLEPRRQGAPPAGAPSVRLRAVTGAIRIARLPPGTAGWPDEE